MLCLTDMWRAADSDPSKRPVDWLRVASTREFQDHRAIVVGIAHDELLQQERGGDTRGGTWAHWQLGLAYAVRS